MRICQCQRQNQVQRRHIDLLRTCTALCRLG